VGYVGPVYRRPIYVAPPAPVYGGFYGPAFHGRFYGRPYWDHRRFR
jgi:hypothetical protein